MENKKKLKGGTTNATNTNGKKYLQEKITDYIINNNIKSLYDVAKVQVRKTVNKYNNTPSADRLQAQAKKQNLLLIVKGDSEQIPLLIGDQDIKDLKQTAVIAMIDSINNGLDLDSTILSGYRAVNQYLLSNRAVQRSDRPFCYCLSDFENGNQTIQIATIKSGIYAIVKGDNDYNNIDNTYNEYEQVKKQVQQEFLITLLELLTPVQKQILKLLAINNSQRQIAERLNRSVSTINEHISNIRKKALKLYENLGAYDRKILNIKL